jgi:hypothetical protein
MTGSFEGTGMVAGKRVSVAAIVTGGEVISGAGPGLFAGVVWAHPQMKTVPIKDSIRNRENFI